MIYPENYEDKVAFSQVRQDLSAKCLSTLGKEYITRMEFISSYDKLILSLQQTDEFKKLLESEDSFPSQFFFDMREELKRIRLEGAYLEEDSLFSLCRSLETEESIVRFLHRKENGQDSDIQTTSFKIESKQESNPYKAYLAKKRGHKKIFINGQWITDEEPQGEESEDEELPSRQAPATQDSRYPRLKELTRGVAIFPQLTRRIHEILDDYGKIKDSASTELLRIRRELSQAEGSVSRVLNQILRQAQAEGFIEKDASPSMRDGRLVIPVSPALKRKIKGIVHDESATGKTVFIEPAEVVEANNHIRELEADERKEIIRILSDFSSLIRPVVPQLLESYEFMALIDFIRAKALYAIETGSTLPVVENRPVINWIEAVHPILKKALAKHDKKVVPLDIRLEANRRILLISGPNAGGKSVCLKTAGLLQYMLQTGMLIPVKENSHAGLFESMFIDIGDEQSIEDELSTYSSHLTNMKMMMRHCSSRSLLLIDEFGGGTEPQIGGALAEAMLKKFNEKECFGVITTHYQNLKLYAEDHEGVVNGAMLYDRHEMKALYQLEIGNPGSSFAVEIARKIGIPDEIIQEASNIVGSEYINADKYLQDIVRDKRYWENKRQNIHQKEKQLEQTLEKYKLEIEELQNSKKQIIIKAKEDAERILKDSNKVIENTIRSIKESQAEKESTRQARKDLETFQKSLSSDDMNAMEDKIARKMQQIASRQQRKKDKAGKKDFHQPEIQKSESIKAKEEVFSIGDTVRLKGQTATGQIVQIKDKNATIAFGTMRTTVKIQRIEHATAPKEVFKASSYITRQTQDAIHEKKVNFRQDIDVRGMRADEAIQTVTYFIDDAMLVGVPRVRILHGTGSGILRTLIRQFLNTQPGVKSAKDEHVQFGGAGITVVEFE